MNQSIKWFDAHLDLAYLAVLGRDMHADPGGAGGPDLPAAVTLPSLRDGHVAACLGTIFTEAGATHAAGYPAGDAGAAHRAGLAQAAVYQGWEQRGDVSLNLRGEAPLDIGILMECADPITTPDELASWVEQGVVAIGLAWGLGSRYAGGNTTTDGLSPSGRDLIEEMDRLDIVHDVSHLSDRAFDELLDADHGAVMASHSNCRALICSPGQPPNQRHLTDAQIRQLLARDAVIGLNLYAPFLIPGGTRQGRATVAQAIDQVEHICMLAGHRGCVGLGSDMDGGFSAERLPLGIELPRDLVKLAEELRRRNWSDADIEGFAWGNWARFWGIA